MPIDINLMIGGEAGQGVQSVGFLLAKALSRSGYHVFADQDYEARVRGGHNFFRVRVKDSEVQAIAETVDILVALNKESMDLHRGDLARRGVIVFDGEVMKDVGSNGNLFGVPLERFAEEKAESKLMANTVALGVALGLVGCNLEIMDKVLREHFGDGEIGRSNIRAAEAGYYYAKDNFKDDFNYRIGSVNNVKRML